MCGGRQRPRVARLPREERGTRRRGLQRTAREREQRGDPRVGLPPPAPRPPTERLERRRGLARRVTVAPEGVEGEGRQPARRRIRRDRFAADGVERQVGAAETQCRRGPRQRFEVGEAGGELEGVGGVAVEQLEPHRRRAQPPGPRRQAQGRGHPVVGVRGPAGRQLPCPDLELTGRGQRTDVVSEGERTRGVAVRGRETDGGPSAPPAVVDPGVDDDPVGHVEVADRQRHVERRPCDAGIPWCGRPCGRESRPGLLARVRTAPFVGQADGRADGQQVRLHEPRLAGAQPPQLGLGGLERLRREGVVDAAA